jgi:hypothetical protein
VGCPEQNKRIAPFNVAVKVDGDGLTTCRLQYSSHLSNFVKRGRPGEISEMPLLPFGDKALVVCMYSSRN